MRVCAWTQLTDDLESAAQKVADDVYFALHMGSRLEEPSITDYFWNDLMRRGLGAPYQLNMYKVTDKSEEAANGTDWEWVITDGSRFISAVVQAKRLYTAPVGYSKLTYRSAGTGQLQIDTLRTYAHAVGAVPLYAFYNPSHLPGPPAKPLFGSVTPGCGMRCLDRSWGVAIAHADNVATAYGASGDTTFATHAPNCLPLRCLMCADEKAPGSFPPRLVGPIEATAEQLARLTAMGAEGRVSKPVPAERYIKRDPTRLGEVALELAARGRGNGESQRVIRVNEEAANVAGIAVIQVSRRMRSWTFPRRG